MLGRKGRPRNSRGDAWGGLGRRGGGTAPRGFFLWLVTCSLLALRHPIALRDKREPHTPGVTRAPSVGWGQVCRREGSDRSAGKPH